MLLMKYEIEENIALLAGLDLGLEGRNTLGTLPYGKYLKEGRMKSQCNFQSVTVQPSKFLLEN